MCKVEIIESINKQIEQLRQELEDYTKQYKNYSRNNFNIFCVCMDTLEDTMSAIEYYFKFGVGSGIGERYIKLYGLLQSVQVQQDAIRELYKVFGYKYNFSKNCNSIRAIRNAVIGHPIDSRHGECVTFLSRCSINNEKFDIIQYDKTLNKDDYKEINYRELIINYLNELDMCIQEIISFHLELRKTFAQ